MDQINLPAEAAQAASENDNDVPLSSHLVAHAQVETDKASRYLKALCNHFARKVKASYDDNQGRVQFPFGECILQIHDNALLLRVTAEDETLLARVKHVVTDHLVRFGAKEELVVNWVDADTSPAH